jgi:hypothetical protein
MAHRRPQRNVDDARLVETIGRRAFRAELARPEMERSGGGRDHGLARRTSILHPFFDRFKIESVVAAHPEARDITAPDHAV